MLSGVLWWVREQPSRTAVQFVRYVSAGNSSKAQQFATGSVLWSLKNKNLPKAEPVQVTAQLVAWSFKWADVETRCLMRLQDGTEDVGTLRVRMVKKGGWKVYEISPYGPVLRGSGIIIYPSAKNGLLEAFRGFTEEVTRKGHPERFLAGDARSAYERNPTRLPEMKFARYEAEGLYCGSGYAVVSIRYRVNGRKAEVIATGIKTGNGWKIAGLAQL